MTTLPPLSRNGIAAHCKRCLSGLPGTQTEVDASRLAIVFYCLGSFDLLDILDEKVTKADQESFREWIWEQQTEGVYGSGFRPGPFMTGQQSKETAKTYTNYDTPHIIMTYTALLSLSILRDDFSRLDRPGLIKFLKSCQKDDGSFTTVPGSGESDLRTLYCAFAISHMLGDWSGVNTTQALDFIRSCRTYEGGYGQSPSCEAQGGTTYTALASLYLAPQSKSLDQLSRVERDATIRWLIHNQANTGGFSGRTGKEADACYCFWCGASLQILGAAEIVNSLGLAKFLGACQFKYGGISKAPDEHPDPYHTYLSLAAISMYPPQSEGEPAATSWKLEALDPLLNAKESTAEWARKHVPSPVS